MPRRRKRKYARRKPRRKRRMRRRRRRRLPLGGVPNKKVVRLRYVETFSLNPAAGSISVQTFRANGPHDPNQTGTGHQPSNYDIFAAQYDTGTVIGSKCTFQHVPVGNTGTIPGLMCMGLYDKVGEMILSYATGIDGLLEQPMVVSSKSIVGTGNDKRVPKLTKYFSHKKFFGTKSVGTTPYVFTPDTNSPSDQAYFECAFASPNNAIDPPSTTFRVTIDYIILFSQKQITIAS